MQSQWAAAFVGCPCHHSSTRLSLPTPPFSDPLSHISLQVFFGLWAKHSMFLYGFTSHVTQRLGGNPPDLEERLVVSMYSKSSFLGCSLGSRTFLRVAFPLRISFVSLRSRGSVMGLTRATQTA